MNRFKFFFKYFILFILVLFFNLIVQPIDYDEIWNFGFAYNVANGLIPYKDFNMIITPLFSFISAIPIYLFGNDILFYQIFNVIFPLLIFYLLERIFNERAYLIIALLFLGFKTLSPSYNLLLLFLYVWLIYLEKNDSNDYLIGIVIALCCLTKQTVGLLLILPSIIYVRDFNKIKKRILGFIVPCFIFLIYLIFTKSFNSFLDLCLFGLFDFGKENSEIHLIPLFIFFSMIISIIYFVIKDKNNIYNYYTLAFIFIVLPMFDYFHLYYAIIAFIILIFINYNLNIKLKYRVIFISLYLGVSLIILSDKQPFIYPNNITNFKYRYIDGDYVEFSEKILNYMSSHDNYNYVFLDGNGYFFKIATNSKITYLDLLNYGNHGINGSTKLLNRIKNTSDNTLFMIDLRELYSTGQTDKSIINYVLENGEEIDSIHCYKVYKLK